MNFWKNFWRKFSEEFLDQIPKKILEETSGRISGGNPWSKAEGKPEINVWTKFPEEFLGLSPKESLDETLEFLEEIHGRNPWRKFLKEFLEKIFG